MAGIREVYYQLSYTSLPSGVTVRYLGTVQIWTPSVVTRTESCPAVKPAGQPPVVPTRPQFS